MHMRCYYLVKPKPLHLATPRVVLNKVVQLFAGVAEPTDILAQLYNYIWTYASGVPDELQLVQPSPASLVVACYNNLFLLYGEW